MENDKPVQAQECFEHHMMLKEDIEELKKYYNEMHCFFFGGIKQNGELSFVDKVNTMYKMMNDNRTALKGFIISSVFVLVSWIFALGCQFTEIRHTISAVNECKNQIEQMKQTDFEINKRLIILESKIK